jgi:ribosomal protein S18 acetylase RimI-like enzyme
LPQASLDTLLEQQYRAQAAGYAAQFPDAVTLIALRGDEPVGRLILAAGDRRWRIVDIVLLPIARGRGIGTDIFDAIAHAARETGVHALGLSVLSTNVAARRLYARLGFSEDNGAPYLEMTKHLDP